MPWNNAKKTTILSFRTTDAFSRAIYRVARAEGRSVSNWIRRQLEPAVEKNLEALREHPEAHPGTRSG